MFAAIAAAATMGVSGAYVEIRTCSIFAGPCHHNSEVMTDGRGAIIALAFHSGVVQGTDLTGLKVAAVIRADENLSLSTERKSVIYVDSRATEKQASTLVALLSRSSGIRFGQTVAVRPAHIEVDVRGLNSKVKVTVGSETVAAGATSDADCQNCSMPGVLWYEPLAHGTSVQVATVEEQAFLDPILGETWIRGNESAAFVGGFVW